MVAETWIGKMGNQVSSNLKNSLLLHQSSLKKKKENYNNSNDSSRSNNNKQEIVRKSTIGILSFEVANLMSKIVHLHKSLSEQEISKLKSEIIKSEGVKKLVSSDESYLLELACSERIDDLNRVAEVVSRLGKKCTVSALQGFEHVYGDILNGVIDVRELGFLVKNMEGMVRKMERYVGTTANLYSEMEVLNELDQATKKFQQNQLVESRRAFEQKLIWQKQDVRHLKDVSLWNQTYDKIVELLARTVCTIYARICVAFGDGDVVLRRNDSRSAAGAVSEFSAAGVSIPLPIREDLAEGNNGKLEKRHSMESNGGSHSGPIERARKKAPNLRAQLSLQKDGMNLFQQDYAYPCGPSPSRILLECLSLSSSASRLDHDFEDDDDDVLDYNDQESCVSGSCSLVSGPKTGHSISIQSGCLNQSKIKIHRSGDLRQPQYSVSDSRFGSKSRLATHAAPSTIGGSALALHYANVIIVIEKLLRYPHLVGEEARDDLYQMLPTSLRKSLRRNLKSYFKNVAIYDAPLAHDWKENVEGILKWLAPLAHDMIRWQGERTFEQQQIVKRANVLLLQTLYFADRDKTERAICELLMGLNYICRYEHQQNALLDCASSFDFGDWMDWQLQCQGSY